MIKMLVTVMLHLLLGVTLVTTKASSRHLNILSYKIVESIVGNYSYILLPGRE